MLHRHEGESLVVISQPAHAWVSGQLARHWGNDDIGLVEADLELQLAAEQHDIAWLDWEASPTLNPDTGLPRAFSQLPTLEHLEIWKSATPRALAYGYLPAALISMHGTYLYERFHDFDADTDEEAEAARAFLRREQEFQQEALQRIYELHGLDEDEVARQRRLVSTWDAMSLALCMGTTERREIVDIPTSAGSLDLDLVPVEGEASTYEVTPWPFKTEAVALRCVGRRLRGTFIDTTAMRAVIRDAPPVVLETLLIPG